VARRDFRHNSDGERRAERFLAFLLDRLGLAPGRACGEEIAQALTSVAAHHVETPRSQLAVIGRAHGGFEDGAEVGVSGPGSVTALVEARREEWRSIRTQDYCKSMTIGSIGKTLANQAIDSAKNSVLDAVRTPAPAKAAEAKPAAATPDTGTVIVAQIQAMQKPLREDQELAVEFRAGNETLRVTEIFVPNPEVLVFAGWMRREYHARYFAGECGTGSLQNSESCDGRRAGAGERAYAATPTEAGVVTRPGIFGPATIKTSAAR